MSKVYNFDDKILQLDSVQLKRTNDVLETREEAVEALLNYSGDDTKDGMPLLARYWSDETHTEIKHLRGYIHNVNGNRGISIDDEGGESKSFSGEPKGVVIKQKVKLKARKTNYFFQHYVIFQMPALLPGASAKVYFPKELIPFNGDENFNSVNTRWRTIGTNGYMESEYSNSVKNIHERGEYVTTWHAYDESDPDSYPYVELSNNTDEVIPKVGLALIANNGGPCVIHVGEQLNEETSVGPGEVGEFYYTGVTVITDGVYNLTSETTSPGFRVENGKIKCYRASDFRGLIKKTIYQYYSTHSSNHFTNNLKYIKDGMVFYYNKRNMNNGMSPVLVRNTRDLIDFMVCTTYSDMASVQDGFLRPADGTLEFVSPVLKRRLWHHKQSPMDDEEQYATPYICNISCDYLGFSESDDYYQKYLVFRVSKTESDSPVTIKSVTVTLRDNNGIERQTTVPIYGNADVPEHESEPWNVKYTLPAEGGSKDFYVHLNNDSWWWGPYVYDNFDGDIKINRVAVEVEYEKERYMMGGLARGIRVETRTRWHDMRNYGKHRWSDEHKTRYFRSRFLGHKLHRCRFVQKFKGVPSEFPELFYIR